MDQVCSPLFRTVDLEPAFNKNLEMLEERDVTARLLGLRQHLLTGEQVLWGIPFQLGNNGAHVPNVLVIRDETIRFAFSSPVKTRYLVFLHGADFRETAANSDGIYRPMMGNPRLGETVSYYVLEYRDGSEYSVPIRRRYNINEFVIPWGENSFECVPHVQPISYMTNSQDMERGEMPKDAWGITQQRVYAQGEYCPAHHWIYPLQNPYPQKEIVSVSFIPKEGTALLFAVSLGDVATSPVRWERRKKVKMTLSDSLSRDGTDMLKKIKMDLGEIISVSPSLRYAANWETDYDTNQPIRSDKDYLVEFTGHPEARIYLGDDNRSLFPIREWLSSPGTVYVNETEIKVTLKVVDSQTQKPVAAKIHVHGRYGDYLSPVNRHRVPNPYWFEDYSVDHVDGLHISTYIDGEAEFKFPVGTIYVEVTKGYEIKPVRKKVTIRKETDTVIIELERVLPWREKGWVTADTHVHFLSPQTALLEGKAEGVNVVNLLTSQWGEMFSNVGDFDGKTTMGSRENGGDGEYLVRVGTENRQQILGHISLIGYEGKMILPLSTGGANESALGDPVESTLIEWASQCLKQKGIVVIPHLPNPRAEGAAVIILGMSDGVEMCSLDDPHGGINPYSLSDWYRYLNCGYHIPVVAGTDKMSAETAVGTIRTYALIKNEIFTYESWKKAVREGRTFVTFGPLVEFRVEGHEPGAKIDLPRGGGVLTVDWTVSSVMIPVTQLELVVNGIVQETKQVSLESGHYSGQWKLKLKDSAWIAIRVRGQYPGRKEVIAAHTSAVMVTVAGKTCFNSQDSVTILEQIEGATAYIQSLGTKAEDKVFKKLLLQLTGAHRTLHNRLHQQGIFHRHSSEDHYHRH